MSDPIGIVESAYAKSATEAEWLASVARTVAANMPSFAGSMLAYTYRVQDTGWIDIQAFTEEGPISFAKSLMFPDIPDDLRNIVASHHLQAGIASMSLKLRPHASQGPMRRYLDQLLLANGIGDLLMVRAIDPTRFGCMVGIPVKTPRTPHRSVSAHWNRLTGHIAAGLRLRRKLAQIERLPNGLDAMSALESESAEAVLQPSGRVEHAEGAATSRSARDGLSTAARAMERARGPLRRRDPEEAVEVWRGLIAGRWSLVDHFDSDGRRYLVAHRNDPRTLDPRGLTERERQVLAYADLGRSNKMIAYELGISPSTVAVLLGRARDKVRTVKPH